MNVWELIPFIAVANVVFHSKGSNYFNGFFDKLFSIAYLIISNTYMHSVKACSQEQNILFKVLLRTRDLPLCRYGRGFDF